MSALTRGARPSDSKASQRRRVAIAEATLSLLRTRDAAEVAVSDIAAEAGVSVATVYNLVGRKDQLLAGVIDAYVHRVSVEVVKQSPATELVQAALSDPLPLGAVVREPGTLNLVQTKGMGIDQLIEPRLCAAGASVSEAREAAQLIVYGFWGTIVSWALGLISDARFRHDAELVSERLLLGTFGTERQGG